ncbi:MAG: FAD-dependent oxidoreductase, partial [Burkholderiaceae bacterium]|nr:FAD-dependent oxidoreductase [Burkholderiaceae bacterium]
MAHGAPLRARDGSFATRRVDRALAQGGGALAILGVIASAVIGRAQLLAQLREPREWDVVVIGGGATGLGIALDAAARGFRTALIEARDFASGTSSRSTKLIHGGVRYLAQGNLNLVREALYERALLLSNAPTLVRPLKFIVPCYRPFEREVMRIGLGIYDALA